MRTLFKTTYDTDINIFKHGGYWRGYGALIAILLAAPWLLTFVQGGDYYLTQLIFISFYSIVGVGLMLLAGFTGQVSLGHAAFFAAGAYTEALVNGYLLAWMKKEWGVDLLFLTPVMFLVSLPAAFVVAAALGILIGLPVRRMSGIYLAISTLAFAFIVEEALARFEWLTGGNVGLFVKPLNFLGIKWSGWTMLYLYLGIAVLVILAARNLLRSPTGRAFIAIRDSAIAAQSMGVDVGWYKVMAFALSAGITGIGGALYAHALPFLSPEAFTILVSIEFLLMIIVGGLGSLHGAVYGAVFLVVVPQLISSSKYILPAVLAESVGLKPLVYGLIIILVMLFEPLGIEGRMRKTQYWFDLFPLYKRGLFRRQRSYTKTEKLH